jgi:beta-phosphoglucomutase-like phosphatase (HAD superfamily)
MTDMHTSAAPPAFTALLFGLRGCLVDFGARTLPVTLQRLYPQHPADQSATLLAAHTVLPQLLGRTPHVNELHAFNHSLSETASEHAEATPGSTALLNDLRQQQVPCAWLDELPRDASIALAAALPDWLLGVSSVTSRPWPAPDACWQALIDLQVDRLDGCVLISGEPRLLQAGLNAGLWTIGLAASGPLCGHAPADWQALDSLERDSLRAQATLALYRLGVHAVTDQLTELGPCLSDLGLRRQKGEKP